VIEGLGFLLGEKKKKRKHRGAKEDRAISTQ
jgi:hypothetical protein